MTRDELRQLSNLSEQVLIHRETGYAKDKKFITSFFVDAGSVEQVRRRLILIDALYSTNMRMRFYGIDELAQRISRFSDDVWREKFSTYLNGNDQEDVGDLFNRGYGIQRGDVNIRRRCPSLISKYAYFLCRDRFDFPIYDNLVIESFEYFREELDFRDQLVPMHGAPVPFMAFRNSLRRLQQESGLSYQQIDYVLWTYGKLKEDSLSSIVTRDEYIGPFRAEYGGIEDAERRRILVDMDTNFPFNFEDAFSILRSIIRVRRIIN